MLAARHCDGVCHLYGTCELRSSRMALVLKRYERSLRAEIAAASWPLNDTVVCPLRFIKLQARAPEAVFKPDVVTQSSHFEILLGCMNHSFAQVGRANRIFANRPQFGELSDVDTRQYVMFLIDQTEFKTKQELDDIHHSTHGGLWFYHNHPEWFTDDMLTPTNMRFLSMLVCLSVYGSLTIWRVIL
jgi:hypothetical protein